VNAKAGSTDTGSWLAAHGRLWYDDRWYRIAWIVGPQALSLFLFATLWLSNPGSQSYIPWGKPKPAFDTPQPPSGTPDPSPPPSDVLTPCTEGEFTAIIPACTALLASGTLKGDNIAYAYWHRGWAYYSTKQYQQAMNDYDRAIAMLPGEADFYNDRGLVWLDTDKNDRALQDFDHVLLLKPDDANGLMNRGLALRNLERPDEALVALSSAITQNSTLWEAYENRAFIYEDRSNWRAMYDDANKMIELDPNDRMGYEFRGHAYLESGQYQLAIADFTKAISLDSAIYGYRMRGRAYYFLDQADNAMADFNAALRIDPKDSDTLSYINDLRRRKRK
jgi:tetratricopeptide (TPR) repeat protein